MYSQLLSGLRDRVRMPDRGSEGNGILYNSAYRVPHGTARTVRCFIDMIGVARGDCTRLPAICWNFGRFMSGATVLDFTMWDPKIIDELHSWGVDCYYINHRDLTEEQTRMLHNKGQWVVRPRDNLSWYWGITDRGVICEFTITGWLDRYAQNLAAEAIDCARVSAREGDPHMSARAGKVLMTLALSPSGIIAEMAWVPA